MNRIIRTAAAAVFALSIGVGVRASPAAIVSVNGGSTSTPALDGWYAAPQVGIALTNMTVGTVNGETTLIIETKTANFSSSAAMAVSFSDPTDVATIQQIEIQGEQVFNGTAQSWSGFNFGVTPNVGGPATFASGVAGSGAFDIPVVNGVTTTGTPTLSGGSLDYTFTQASDTTANWGLAAEDGRYLLLDLNGATSFTLEETPVVGSVSVIPLPAAAWQGLVGLLGLGAIALGRKIKYSIA